jgi:DNA-binding beta-propeller fold protein YncE
MMVAMRTTPRRAGCLFVLLGLLAADIGCGGDDAPSADGGADAGDAGTDAGFAAADVPMSSDPRFTGGLFVRVLDARGLAVANAEVSTDPASTTQFTDGLGSVLFRGLAPGFYAVTAVHATGGNARLATTVVAGAIAELNLTLMPAAAGTPRVTITAPAPGTVISAPTFVTLAGTVSDDRDPPGGLTVQWTSNRDGLLSPSGHPLADGTTAISIRLSVGTHTITLKATDSGGLVGQASTQITVTVVVTPPIDAALPPPPGPDTGALPDAAVDAAEPLPFIAINSQVARMVVDRKRPYLYAIDSVNNQLHFVNLTTNTLEKSIFVGSKPADLAINVANTELFIADFGATEIAVVNLETREKARSLTVNTKVGTWDGNPYRLVCTASDTLVFTSLDQWNDLKLVNATTGMHIAVADSIYQPELVASADGTRVYMGESGISTVTLKRYDVTASTIMSVDSSGDAGSYAGRSLAISGDGNFVFFAGKKFLAKNLKSVLGTFSEPIMLASQDGSIAVGSKSIHDGNLFSVIRALPVSTNIMALAPDDNTLYLYDTGTSRIYIHKLK